MDDHSGDGSAALVRALAARDHRVRLYPNPEKGLVSALNHGLRQCRGPLVARMDADDRMRPQRLSTHLAHFRTTPRLTLSATQVSLFPETAIQAGYREYVRWQNACLTPEQIAQASLRSRERFWDIRVPKIDSIFDNSLVPRPSWSPGVPPQHRKLVAATHRSPI